MFVYSYELIWLLGLFKHIFSISDLFKIDCFLSKPTKRDIEFDIPIAVWNKTFVYLTDKAPSYPLESIVHMRGGGEISFNFLPYELVQFKGEKSTPCEFQQCFNALLKAYLGQHFVMEVSELFYIFLRFLQTKE